MKYFLAIDKGNTGSLNERYTLLDLSKINSELNKDNNLRALVKFTCSFNTKYELKTFLIEKGVLNSKNNFYDLVIYYGGINIRTLDIAYKCDEQYFDINILKAIISDKAKNNTFLEGLLARYKNYKFLAEEIRIIKAYASAPIADHKFYAAIRDFVNKICFENKILNYKAIYDLGLLVSKLTNNGRERLINYLPSFATKNNYQREVSEELAFELEQIEEKIKKLDDDNGQIKLF